MRVGLLLLLSLLAALHTAAALYEDQAGVVDWSFKLVGPVKFAVIQDRLNSVFVGTTSHVVASLHARSGDIQWRNVLPDGEDIDGLHVQEKGLISLSNGGKRLRKWDLQSGLLLWEQIAVPDALAPTHASTLDEPALFKVSENSIVVARNHVTAISGRTGQLIWRTALPEGFHQSTAAYIAHLSSLLVVGQSAEGTLTALLVDKAGSLTSTSLASAFDARELKTATTALFGKSFLILATPSGKVSCVSVSNQQGSSVATFTLPPSESKPAITLIDEGTAVVTIGSQNLFLRADEDKVAKLNQADHLGPSLFAPIRFNKLPAVVSLRLRSATISHREPCSSLVEVLQIPTLAPVEGFPKTTGLPTLDASPVFARPSEHQLLDGPFPWRVFALAHASAVEIKLLLSLPDGKLVFLELTPSGAKALWAREEALSQIVQSEYFELPARESLVDALDHEFGHSGGLFARASTQLNQLVSFARTPSKSLAGLFFAQESKHASSSASSPSVSAKSPSLFTHPATLTSEYLGASDVTRDTFGFRQLLIAVTSSGAVFGLNTEDGEVYWKTRLFSSLEGRETLTIANDGALFVLRTSAHYPFLPAVAVVARGPLSTFVFVLNPLTGEFYPFSQPKHASDSLHAFYSFPSTRAQVVVTPASSQHESRVLLVHDVANDVGFTIPQSADAVKALHDLEKPLVVYAVDRQSGAVSGSAIVKSARSAGDFPADVFVVGLQRVWSMQFSPTLESIVAVGTRPTYEAVNSVGRVLGNRSVLYKYLNPNLITLATITEKPVRTLTVYAIDTVTGGVVFKSAHEKVGPAHTVHVVQCENWVVYHFLNAKLKRNEFVVFELYEDESRYKKTTFSSYENSPPIISRKSYVFQTSVTSLAVTTTVGGITNRQVLLGLPSGWILAMDKHFLDPRRPTSTLTEEDKEEGLIPYSAELPFLTTSIINYNRTIPHLKKIHTGHASLESASLVFAHGLDVFHTRVHPSKTFDVLNEDFNFALLFFTLGALSIGTVVSSVMLKRKQLVAAWK